MRFAFFMFALVMAAPVMAGDTKPATTAQPGSDKDKLICRREVPVGSLIATRKMCMTEKQWQKRADDGNAAARALVEDAAGACGQAICQL